MKRKRIIINRDFFIFIICCILSIILFLSKDIKAVKNIKTHTSNFFSFLFSPKDSAIKFSNIESRNNFLINKLKKINNDIKLIDEHGVDGDFVESQAFAYLAVRSYLNLPISFPETTGVKKPCSGGIIVKY